LGRFSRFRLMLKHRSIYSDVDQTQPREQHHQEEHIDNKRPNSQIGKIQKEIWVEASEVTVNHDPPEVNKRVYEPRTHILPSIFLVEFGKHPLKDEGYGKDVVKYQR